MTTIRQLLDSQAVGYYIPASPIKNFPLEDHKDFRTAIICRDKNKPASTIWINYVINFGEELEAPYIYACQLATNGTYVLSEMKIYAQSRSHDEEGITLPGIAPGLQENDLIPDHILRVIQFSQYIQTKLNRGGCTDLISCFLIAGVLNIPNSLTHRDNYYPFLMYEKMYGNCDDLLINTMQRNKGLAHPDEFEVTLTREQKMEYFYGYHLLWLYICWQGYKLMHELHMLEIYHFSFTLNAFQFRVANGKLIVKIGNLNSACTPKLNTTDPLYRPCSCNRCQNPPPDWPMAETSAIDIAHAEDADVYSFTISILQRLEWAQQQDPFMQELMEVALRRNMALQKAIDLAVTATKDDFSSREAAHILSERKWIADHQVGRYDSVDEVLAMAFEQAFKWESTFTSLDIAKPAQEFNDVNIQYEEEARRKQHKRKAKGLAYIHSHHTPALPPDVAPMAQNLHLGDPLDERKRPRLSDIITPQSDVVMGDQ
jgi:hypothetical protein